MDNYLIYLGKASVLLSIFYFIYFILFRNDSFLRFTRFFLLLGLVVSIFLPIVDIESVTIETSQSFMHIFIDPVIIGELDEFKALNPVQKGCIISDILKVIVFLYLLSIIKKISQFMKIKRHSEYQKGFFIVDNKYGNFSFFHWIFIRKIDFEANNFRQIYQHEQAHSKQFHSLDILFVELLTAFFFFHPIFWLYKKSLKQTHEYLADKAVLVQGTNTHKYMQLLINQAISSNFYLANSFNESLTLKRLHMMKTWSSKRTHTIKILALFPILSAIFFLSSLNIQAQEVEAEDGQFFMQNKEVVLKKADQGAEYPGGENALRREVAMEVNYPEAAKMQKIKGVVFVRFVVNKKGIVVESEVVKSAHPLLDKEALRVINSLKKWNPAMHNGEAVNVFYSIPISFKLK